MPKTRMSSPARSQGATTPRRRKEPRGSRSVCSPALSTASGRLTSLIDQFKDKNMDSFALSPLNGRSVLNDNTDIDEPRRKSWWKKLDDNSRDVMEVLQENKVADINNVIEEFIDIEVLSQEKYDETLDLPRSSDSESINSIVLPQRKLFTLKENQPQKKFSQCIGNRESLAKLHKTNTNIDKTVNVGTKELFQNNKRTKPVFPAALLNISPNKTSDKTRENLVVEPKPQVRNIFGNRPANARKNMFANFIMSDSEDEIPEIQPKVFGFQKKLEQRKFSSVSKGRDPSPTSSITTDMEMDEWKLLPSSTMVENQLEDMMVCQTPVKKARLSKLSEAKESEFGTNTVQTFTTFDKTQSNKSVSSKNKSKYSEKKDKSLENSRTTRSMSRNSSKREENMIKLDTKNNKSLRNNSSKNNEVDESLIKSANARDPGEERESEELENEVIETKYDIDGPSKLENLLQDNENREESQQMEIGGNKTKDNGVSYSKLKNTLKEDELEQEDQEMKNEADKTKNNQNQQIEIGANKTKDNSANYSKLKNTLKDVEVEQEDQEMINEADKTKNNQNQQMEIGANKTKDNSANYSKLKNTLKEVEVEQEDQQMINEADKTKNNQNQQMEIGANKTKDNGANYSKLKNTLKEVEVEQEDQEIENEADKTKNNDQCSTMLGNTLKDGREVPEIYNKTMDDNKAPTNLNNTLIQQGKQKRKSQEEKDNATIETKDNDEGPSKLENTPHQEDEEEQESQELEKEENNDENIESQEVEAEMSEVIEDANESEKEQEANETELEGAESENEEENENEQEEIESDQDEANDSKEEEVNDSAVEANDSEQEEANETEDKNESHQIEANESQEIQKEVNNSQPEVQEEVNNSQEVQDKAENYQENEDEENQNRNDNDEIDNQEYEEKADESKELANVSQEAEDEEEENHVSLHYDQSEEESHENEDTADEDQESEKEDEQESESEVNESVEAVEEMECSDEADKAIASDDGISDQDDQEEMELDEQSNEAVDGSEQLENETNETQNAEPSAEEIEESPNVTHDTTGRSRNKHAQNKSPEVILHHKTNQMDSFTVEDRNNSVRKTKSMIKNLNIRPSLAPPRDSTGFSDGTKNSSAEGSGWDSHRTTRKTLRQTFGKDFTPRKSLRALVMEKSAKRQTEHMDMHSDTVKFPQANSTELPEDSNRFNEDIVESDHEESRRMRQTTLELYLQKIKQQNMERRVKMAEAVRNSLKAPPRDPLNIFKVPSKPAPRLKTSQSKPKKQIKSIISLDELPAEILQDMKYKPPKRFQPSNASWITKRLYKYLENKLEPKYDYKARVRAEKLVETLYHFAKDLRRHQVAPTDAVEVLKFEFARLEIVKTHHQFYGFFHEFMPREVRVKVVPDIVNKIPLPRHGVFSDILRTK